MLHPLKKIVDQNRSGVPVGICSVCSSNEFVIESAMEESCRYHSTLLIEATANQVNQFGGYTGMTPQTFRSYVLGIAERTGFPAKDIVLGGDHLGPLTWKSEKAEDAMEKAKTLVALFARAGFTKIHLDTSMKLGGDADGRLDPEIVAERGAGLCEAAESSLGLSGNNRRPVYVIGSEVPIPGGAQAEDGLTVTSAENFAETVELFKNSFLQHGLERAWENVIAVVVQPGVEFGSHAVHDYNRVEAQNLIHAVGRYPNLVFEGHSTDYQKQSSLKQMVEDHIAILKVGPALTFAFREGLMSLEQMEKDLLFGQNALSDFSGALEKAMLRNPSNWKQYFKGGEIQQRLDRKYSYSDRCRYYFSDAAVQGAVDRLFRNLGPVSLPMPMISQYFPSAYWKIRNGEMRGTPEDLAKERIKETLDMYYSAVTPS